MTEQDQELAPLPRHQFDMVPPSVRQIFEDVLKYRVDPSGNCYGVKLNSIVDQLQALDTHAVVAIDSDTSTHKKDTCTIQFYKVLFKVLAAKSAAGTWKKPP